MRKILSLFLFASLLLACGDDKDDNQPLTGRYPLSDWTGNWNDPQNVNYEQYKGNYNPIIGEWKVTELNGMPDKIALIYRFKADFTCDMISGIPATTRTFTYQLNKQQILMDGVLYKYAISDLNRSLKIIEGGVQTLKATFDSKDLSDPSNWNNSTDPNFVPSGYNPLKGTWKLVKEAGQPTTKSLYYKFDDNRNWSMSDKLTGNYTNLHAYRLNNTVLRIVQEMGADVVRTFTYEYQINDDSLSMYLTCPYLQSVENEQVFVRQN